MGGIVEADVNPSQEVAQGLFIDGEICMLKRQQAKRGVLGRRPVCDYGAVAALLYN